MDIRVGHGFYDSNQYLIQKTSSHAGFFECGSYPKFWIEVGFRPSDRISFASLGSHQSEFFEVQTGAFGQPFRSKTRWIKQKKYDFESAMSCRWVFRRNDFFFFNKKSFYKRKKKVNKKSFPDFHDRVCFHSTIQTYMRERPLEKAKKKEKDEKKKPISNTK